MADWKTNPIMEWSTDGGTTWSSISDHGRAPLDISVDRIEVKQRMANGRMRRYVVAKKHTFTVSWENLPSESVPFLANGQSGNWMEDFHNNTNGSFMMRLRAGKDISANTPVTYEVMITDFSKEIRKRTPSFDLLNIDITLEEV